MCTAEMISAAWGHLESYVPPPPPPDRTPDPGSPGAFRVVGMVPVTRALRGRGVGVGLQGSHHRWYGLGRWLIAHPRMWHSWVVWGLGIPFSVGILSREVVRWVHARQGCPQSWMHTYNDLVDLLVEVAIEKESNVHMGKHINRHLCRMQNDRGEPRPHNPNPHRKNPVTNSPPPPPPSKGNGSP